MGRVKHFDQDILVGCLVSMSGGGGGGLDASRPIRRYSCK